MSEKTLFVFSDPGGAKPMLALASTYKKEDILIVSDRNYTFYKDFGLDVTTFSGEPADLIDSFSPVKIITGTSYTSDVEKRFIVAAKQKELPVVSFIDHWTSFLARFYKDGEYIFPDEIWVLDERAAALGIEEGLPPTLIKVKGNPYHKYLASWQPIIKREDLNAVFGVELPSSKPYIIYAPDPLSNVNGNEKFGFDELTATKKLVKLTKRISRYNFVLKPHPNQDINNLLPLLDKNWLVVSAQSDSNTLIYYSAAVIGFFSNFLIESLLMGKKVYRFLGPETKYDPLKEMDLGQVVDSDQLAEILQNGN